MQNKNINVNKYKCKQKYDSKQNMTADYMREKNISVHKNKDENVNKYVSVRKNIKINNISM